MRFTVNETETGIQAPAKDICKVQGCPNGRFKKRGGNVFCKKHSGLRTQVSKKKFKELAGSNEMVVWEVAPRKKGVTSKKKKLRSLRKEILEV